MCLDAKGRKILMGRLAGTGTGMSLAPFTDRWARVGRVLCLLSHLSYCTRYLPGEDGSMKFFTVQVTKGLTLSQLREVIEQAIAEKASRAIERIPSDIIWDLGDFSAGMNEESGLLTLWARFDSILMDPIFEFIKSRRLYFMTITIMNDDCWSYALTQAGNSVDRFATLPDHVTSFELRDTVKGDPATLEAVLGIDTEVSAKYLRWWRTPQDTRGWSEEEEDEYFDHLDNLDDPPGKANETDEASYGDAWQMLDFVRAIGGMWPPKNDGRWIQFEVPKSAKA